MLGVELDQNETITSVQVDHAVDNRHDDGWHEQLTERDAKSNDEAGESVANASERIKMARNNGSSLEEPVDEYHHHTSLPLNSAGEQDFLADILADLQAEADPSAHHRFSGAAGASGPEESHEPPNAWDFAALYGDATPDLAYALAHADGERFTPNHKHRMSLSGGYPSVENEWSNAPPSDTYTGEHAVFGTQYLQLSSFLSRREEESSKMDLGDTRVRMASASSTSSDLAQRGTSGDHTNDRDPCMNRDLWSCNSAHPANQARLQQGHSKSYLFGNVSGQNATHELHRTVPMGGCEIKSQLPNQNAELANDHEQGFTMGYRSGSRSKKRKSDKREWSTKESSVDPNCGSIHDEVTDDHSGLYDSRYIEIVKNKLGMPRARLEQHPLLGRLHMQQVDGCREWKPEWLESYETGNIKVSPLTQCTNSQYPTNVLPESNVPHTDASTREPFSGTEASRRRLVWTPALHERFVKAVNEIGVDHAMPKVLVSIMNVEGLTSEHVKSHLQKYRKNLSKSRETRSSATTDSNEVAHGTSTANHQKDQPKRSSEAEQGHWRSNVDSMAQPPPLHRPCTERSHLLPGEPTEDRYEGKAQHGFETALSEAIIVPPFWPEENESSERPTASFADARSLTDTMISPSTDEQRSETEQGSATASPAVRNQMEWMLRRTALIQRQFQQLLEKQGELLRQDSPWSDLTALQQEQETIARQQQDIERELDRQQQQVFQVAKAFLVGPNHDRSNHETT